MNYRITSTTPNVRYYWTGYGWDLNPKRASPFPNIAGVEFVIAGGFHPPPPGQVGWEEVPRESASQAPAHRGEW